MCVECVDRWTSDSVHHILTLRKLVQWILAEVFYLAVRGFRVPLSMCTLNFVTENLVERVYSLTLHESSLQILFHKY